MRLIAAILVLVLSCMLYAQSVQSEIEKLPPELQVSDPEARTHWIISLELGKLGKYSDAEAELNKGVAICAQRHIVSDCAVLKSLLAQWKFVSGDLDLSYKLNQEAFDLAGRAGNVLLQSDLLVAQSVRNRLQNEVPAGKAKLERAVELAQKSKHKQMLARAYGEQASYLLWAGELQEARKAIELAIEIDEANNYDLKNQHLFYRAQVVKAEKGSNEEVVGLIDKSRNGFLLTGDLTNFAISTLELARTLTDLGDSEKAMRLLELCRAGRTLNEKNTAEDVEGLQRVVELPIIKYALLVTQAEIHKTRNESNQAFDVYLDAFNSSGKAHLTTIHAASALELARLAFSSNRLDEAERFARIAYQESETLGLDYQGRDAQLILSDALMGLQRPAEAIPLLEAVGASALQNENTWLTFIVESELGRAEFLRQNYKEASRHWDKADIYVPGLATNRKNNKNVLAPRLVNHYRGQLAAYFQQERVLEALMTWAKAIVAMEELEDKANWTAFLNELGDAIHRGKLRDVVEEADKEKRWLEALTLAQVLDIYDSRSAGTFGKVTSPNGENSDRLFRVPFAMTATEAGVKDLEFNLSHMGSVSPLMRRIAREALLIYYFRIANPGKAYQYGAELLPYLDLERPSPFHSDVRSGCLFAISALQSGHSEEGKAYAQKCLDSAKRLGDQNLIRTAQDIQTRALLYADPSKAQNVINEVLARASDDLEARYQLARTYEAQGNIVEAVNTFNSLLSVATSQGNTTLQAKLNLDIAKVLVAGWKPSGGLRDPAPYLAFAEQIYRHGSDNEILVDLYLTVADYALKRRVKADALGALSKAKEAAKSTPSLLIRCIEKQAEVFSKFGDVKAAIKEREEGIGKCCGEDRTLLVTLLVKQGSDYETLGKIKEAIETYQRAVRVADETNSAFYRRWPRQSLGSLYSGRSEYFLAVKQFKEALAIAKSGNDVTGIGWISKDLGWAYYNLGEWSDAATAAEDAIKAAQRAESTPLEFYSIDLLMNVLGDRRSLVKDLPRAMSLMSRAESLSEKDASLSTDDMSEILPEIYWQLGDYDSAIKRALAAVDRLRKEDNRYGVIHALASTAELFMRKGELQAAETKLSESYKLIDWKKADSYTKGRWHYARAQLYRAEGKHAEAVSTYEHVLLFLAELKATIRDSESARKASETYGFVYDELVDTSFELSQKLKEDKSIPAKALQFGEAEKGRQFLAAWGPLFARQLALDLPLPIRERELALAFEATNKMAQVMQAESNGSQQEIEGQRQLERNAKNDFATFVDALRVSHPAYASIKYPRAALLSDVKRKPGEAVLVFRVTPAATFIWLVSDDGVLFTKSAKTRQWFRNEIEGIRNLFNASRADSEVDARLGNLFEVLLPDAELRSRLLASRSITVIPDDFLFLIPLETLTSPSRVGFPLLDKPIRYFPSLASLVISQQLPPSKGWKSELVAFANPIFSEETTAPKATSEEVRGLLSRGLRLDPLPGTEIELREISKLFPPTSIQVFYGRDATKERVMQTDLSSYRFAHFATHGLLPTDSNLIEPALAFSVRVDRPDSFLKMSEVLQLQLSAEMVVLSACNTGSGVVDHVEGVQNLGRAFMLAGARSTVISLWQVADDSTALLMKEFYGNVLAGKTKAESLALARKAVFSRGYKSPFYWAPFILMGE